MLFLCPAMLPLVQHIKFKSYPVKKKRKKRTEMKKAKRKKKKKERLNERIEKEEKKKWKKKRWVKSCGWWALNVCLITEMSLKTELWKLKTYFRIRFDCFKWYQSHSFLAGDSVVVFSVSPSVSTRNFGAPLLCSLLTVVGATLVVKWIPRTEL